jgi:geranylgeranyl pyrophosphate synthase
MATLVHDDLIDGAEFRARPRVGLVGLRSGRGAATGDYLFARAFASSTATGDRRASRCCRRALCLARGEAMQRPQTHDRITTVEATSSAAA